MAVRQKLSSSLFVVVVVSIGLIVFAIVTIENKILPQQSEQAQQQAPQATANVPGTVPGPAGIPQPSFPPTPPETAPVYAYAGRVQAVDIDKKILTLDTAYGTKLVTYTAETKIVSRIKPTSNEQQRLTAAELQARYSRETEFTGTVEQHDAIIAEAKEDLRGKSAFTATKIIIIQ